MKTATVNNEFISLTVSTYGAEIQSVKIRGKESIWQGEKFWHGKAPILFPMAGALKNRIYNYMGKDYDMPFHGFARHSLFELLQEKEDTLIFRLVSNEETKKSFPFDFEFLVTYKLEGMQVITTYEVINHDEKDMYFSIGSHESYTFNGDLSDCALIFEKKENLYSKIVVDNALIVKDYDNFGENTNRFELGDSLFLHDTVVLSEINSRKVTLLNKEQPFATVEFDAPNLLIWSTAGAPFVCIEPWLNLPDYTDASGKIEEKPGIIKLEKNKKFVNSHKVTYY